jgi:hypothetical protein
MTDMEACLALAFTAFMAGAGPASGFTFSDGESVGCYANGAPVPEVVLDAPPVELSFTGKAIREGDGYRIIWNEKKLDSLPPEVHDFIFFHECAHAKIDSMDETMANCAGLKDMREAGRAGPGVEAKLATFYGAGNAYWARTLKCANGG